MSGPIRQCLVSREKQNPSGLLRFVWQDAKVVWDQEQLLAGRGAYLLPTKKVIEEARQIKIWRRAFRIAADTKIDFVSLNQVLDQVLESLREE